VDQPSVGAHRHLTKPLPLFCFRHEASMIEGHAAISDPSTNTSV
jgi:hypothetical protein